MIWPLGRYTVVPNRHWPLYLFVILAQGFLQSNYDPLASSIRLVANIRLVELPVSFACCALHVQEVMLAVFVIVVWFMMNAVVVAVLCTSPSWPGAHVQRLDWGFDHAALM